MPSLSIVIPAHNEAAHLPATLQHIAVATRQLEAAGRCPVQLIVVDDDSRDATADLARAGGATVLRVAEHNIGRVRNAGAAVAMHEVLVFLDADVLVPPGLLVRIAHAMADPACAGGAVDTFYRPRRRMVRGYLALWRLVGLAAGVAQGACQFSRRALFDELGGYDESQYMGEDVDFYRRLKSAARRRGLRTCFIRDVQVVPSTRRFDQWPAWKTFVWTNPLLVVALRRRRGFWKGWYTDAPR